MRVFWLVIVVLALVTMGLLIARRGGTPAPNMVPGPAPALPAAAPQVPATSTPPPVVPEPAAKEVAPPASEPLNRPVTPPIKQADVPAKPAAPAAAAPSAQETAEPKVATNPDAAVTTAPTPAPEKAKIEPQEDGWTRVDDRFLIRGAGTSEDPLLVPWDMLVSASETYRPRLGRKVLPDRISMLNGKHVRLTGFVLFPMLSQDTKELLLMRSQWDGCCIGVPPTPYDAVEVKLAETATRQDLFVQYATLEGVMKVEPYVNRDWLLGLYVLEDTKVLKMSDEGVQRPTHAPGTPPPEGSPS